MTLFDSISRNTTLADIAAGERACPVCSRESNEFVALSALADDLRRLIEANASDAGLFPAVCPRCV